MRQGMAGRALAVLLTATFMGQFDFFVVNVAAPSLQRDLRASDALLELVVGGYAFAYAAGLITGGRLGDLFGHRRMYVGGMAAFTVSSVACGLARSPVELVVARLAEGLSAAAMLPQVLALITATIASRSRPRALAFYGVASGTGAIAGQILGGALVSADIAGLGWRLIFLINLPIGTVAAVLAARWLPEPAARAGKAGLDPLGALGTAGALALALVPLTVGADQGWPPWTWAVLAAAIPVMAGTFWWQRHLGRRGGQPVIDLSLFSYPTFRAGLAANACFMAYFGSFMFALTLFLQDGLRLTPLQAGLAFAPAGVAFSASALAGPRLLRRYGPRAVVAGSLTTAAALAALLVLAHAAHTGTGLAAVIAAAAIGSLGNGIVLPALIGTSLVDVKPHQAGAGAGLLTTAQQFASSAGVAVVGTIFFAIAGHSHASPGGYAAGMTAAAGVDLALTVTVAVLTGLIARSATARQNQQRHNPEQAAGSAAEGSPRPQSGHPINGISRPGHGA
jgi:EmrB/QacA subfamily drug resistance transporter